MPGSGAETGNGRAVQDCWGETQRRAQTQAEWNGGSRAYGTPGTDDVSEYDSGSGTQGRCQTWGQVPHPRGPQWNGDGACGRSEVHLGGPALHGRSRA